MRTSSLFEGSLRVEDAEIVQRQFLWHPLFVHRVDDSAARALALTLLGHFLASVVLDVEDGAAVLRLVRQRKTMLLQFSLAQQEGGEQFVEKIT